MSRASTSVIGLVVACVFEAWACTGVAQPRESERGEDQETKQDHSAAIAANLCATLDAPTCIVQIRISFKNGGQQGTGVLLDNGNILTAAHVVRSDVGLPVTRIEVIFGGRSGNPETDASIGAAGNNIGIMVTDKDRDLAVLSGLNVPKWAYGAPLANAPVKVGVSLASVGLERPASVRLHAAPIVELEQKKPHLLMAVQSQRGNSGGPVFNRQGGLVGIVSAREVVTKVERKKLGNFGELIEWEFVPATRVIDLQRVMDGDAQIRKLVREGAPIHAHPRK